MGMIYSRMIFSHGFVHCDPHPGNVLVNPIGDAKKDREFQIVLLDHGLYQVSY
jgi:aarF domain-containing kinase